MTDHDKKTLDLSPDPKRCRAPLATALQNRYSRRAFLATAVAAPAILASLPLTTNAAGEVITFKSPNGQLQFLLFTTGNQLRYRITRANRIVVDLSELKMLVDGVDLCRVATITRIERYGISERYGTRGVHSTAVNNCLGARISIREAADKADYIIDLRVYDNGVAFRYVIAGTGSRVADEATAFTIPAGSTVWFHDFEGHYEGVHQKKEIAAVKEGEWAAPPLTIKLSNGLGYAAITEAALVNYAGMGLQANGQRGFKTVLGHALPVSHPFDLRYGKEEARRLSQPATIEGTITTPWRVVIIGTDLNALVNCDIVSNVSARPDPRLFPQGLKTDWLRPGRAVWRYLDGGENTFEGIKEFSRLAGELGFEHQVVEGLWHRWTEDEMRELVEYSKQRHVGIWFWEHSKNLRSADAREKFFSQLSRLGVVGAKVDFFDHEAKEIIDLYQALLRSSAEHRIMVEFHGANKPTGESRTWPNEMTREAIRGLEYRSMQTRAVHNTTLPFTRFLAGHGDYTPVHFGERRRETSWAHQIATAIVFTSPLMIYGAHPKSILENPAVEIIKSIPSVWDETIVLPPSEIGELAVFARRRGNTWFVGILNGELEKSIGLPLSFLGAGKYRGTVVSDQMDQPAAVRLENSVASRRSQIRIEMRSGGGFVGRFQR